MDFNEEYNNLVEKDYIFSSSSEENILCEVRIRNTSFNLKTYKTYVNMYC